jgi:excisionase family DNA binding protein
MSVGEAAATLGISIRKVWELRAIGTLTAVRIGRATRFRMSDVQKIVQRRVET